MIYKKGVGPKLQVLHLMIRQSGRSRKTPKRHGDTDEDRAQEEQRQQVKTLIKKCDASDEELLTLKDKLVRCQKVLSSYENLKTEYETVLARAELNAARATVEAEDLRTEVVFLKKILKDASSTFT